MDNFRGKLLAVLHHVINDDYWASKFRENHLNVLAEFGIPPNHPFAEILDKIRNANNPPTPTAVDTFRLLQLLGDEILAIEQNASIW